jgi:PAS domain S-box-containing protein
MFESLHKAWQQTAENSELLRTTIASIGDAVITTDAHGRITRMNAVAESLTGWSIDDARGQPLDAVFCIANEHTRQPVENPATRALREGVIVGLGNHNVLIAKDGTERPIDDSAAPIRGHDGENIGSVLVFRDVTDRRRLEKQITDRLAAARLLACIIESSEDAIITKSLDGIIESWNAAAERLFGYTAEQAVGRPVSMLIPAERRDEEAQILARIRAGKRVEPYETVRLRHDGRSIPISLTVSPIKDEAGRIIGASKIARDITELKKVEGALREADRRKDEFLATLAHELRNPLAPLKNSLELIKRARGNADRIDQARSTMERQIAQMVRLIDDLLDVSRITRDKLELKTQRVELASIAHDATEAYRPDYQRAGHELYVALPAEPIYLRADPVRLAQVFGNLLANSCKYTEPGGRIWLSAERQGNDVAVKVKDTGVGIPPEMLPRVFDLFTQVHRSLERSEGGLGIGLSLVKRLVEMHGGTVTAHSEGPGRGSEFVVRLPVLIESPNAQPLPGPTGEPTPKTTHRILIVDDNRDGADSLAALLQVTGNNTQTAHDGVEAMERAAAFRPKVILLDIGLPKLNGYEVCRAIREQPWGKDLVMVAVTGWGQEEDRVKSREAGFNGHMVKPVDHAALMKLLAALSSIESPS